MSADPLVFESLSDRVSKFNEKVNKHLESQLLNPFSDSFKGNNSRSPSPRPKFSKEEYGKPIAGSKTEQRGRKAHSHICKEILELCEIIYDVGTYNAKCRAAAEDDEGNQPSSDDIIVTFGELFQLYTKISSKVVGLLLAAKKRGLIYFEGEMLFQRRDDHVLIALLKPIDEIRKIMQDGTPVQTTPDEQESEETTEK